MHPNSVTYISVSKFKSETIFGNMEAVRMWPTVIYERRAVSYKGGTRIMHRKGLLHYKQAFFATEKLSRTHPYSKSHLKTSRSSFQYSKVVLSILICIATLFHFTSIRILHSLLSMKAQSIPTKVFSCSSLITVKLVCFNTI